MCIEVEIGNESYCIARKLVQTKTLASFRLLLLMMFRETRARLELEYMYSIAETLYIYERKKHYILYETQIIQCM